MNEWLIDFVYLVSNSIHSYINQERILDLIFSLHLSLSFPFLISFDYFMWPKALALKKKTKIFFIFMSIQKTTSNITDDDDNDDSWPFMFITHTNTSSLFFLHLASTTTKTASISFQKKNRFHQLGEFFFVWKIKNSWYFTGVCVFVCRVHLFPLTLLFLLLYELQLFVYVWLLICTCFFFHSFENEWMMKDHFSWKWMITGQL